jgi:hypothetical protein
MESKDRIFSSSLSDFGIRRGPSGNALPWKIATAILGLAVLALTGLLITKSTSKNSTSPIVGALSGDLTHAQLAAKANAFLGSYMAFMAGKFVENRAILDELCTPEYLQTYELVWSDPRLTAAIQEREATVELIDLAAPRLLEVTEDGRYLVAVSGKMRITSPKTYFPTQLRYIAGTLTLVNQKGAIKIANAIWKNIER